MADDPKDTQAESDTRPDTPSPVRQVGDRGLASPEPASTTEEEPDSALGGGTATRSAIRPEGAEATKRTR